MPEGRDAPCEIGYVCMKNKGVSDTPRGGRIDTLLSTMPESGRYFLKAVIVAGILIFVGKTAAYIPSAAIPLIVAAFAVFSTAGVMYGVVARRLHRQYKLKESGQLSKRNRGWTFWLVGYFALSLVSGFMFMLESPRWDAAEWAMVWLAVPVYYVVFCYVQCCLAKEYKAEFCKAGAMRASLFVVAAFLCLAYTIASAEFGTEYDTPFSELVQSAYQPFEESSSALLRELGKATAFSNALTAFGLNQISTAPLVIVLAVRFVVYFSVFMGIAGLLGSCLLSWKEAKRELQLLPIDGEFRESEPVRGWYLGVLAVLLVVSVFAFGMAEDRVSNVRAANGRTAIDTFVDEQTENITFLQKNGIGDAKRLAAMQERIDKAGQLVADCERRRAEELRPMIDSYFDECLGNVDAYLDWHEGFFGGALKMLNSMGVPVAGTVRDEFRNQMRNGFDASAIEGRFAEYQEELKGLKANSVAIPLALVPSELVDTERFAGQYAQGTTDTSLDLWASLEGERGAEKAGAALLGVGSADRETLKARVVELIESVREDALAAVSDTGHSV